MTKDITVKETKQKKLELEEAISNLIYQFHEETGCLVNEIHLHHLHLSSFGGVAIFDPKEVRTTIKTTVEL